MFKEWINGDIITAEDMNRLEESSSIFPIKVISKEPYTGPPSIHNYNLICDHSAAEIIQAYNDNKIPVFFYEVAMNSATTYYLIFFPKNISYMQGELQALYFEYLRYPDVKRSDLYPYSNYRIIVKVTGLIGLIEPKIKTVEYSSVTGFKDGQVSHYWAANTIIPDYAYYDGHKLYATQYDEFERPQNYCLVEPVINAGNIYSIVIYYIFISGGFWQAKQKEIVFD